MATEKKKEFIDNVIDIRRVTKVTKGGKRFSFTATVVSGDQQGSVGLGKGSANAVNEAIAKATSNAKKNMTLISFRGDTLHYDVKGKHGAALVILRPAYKGTGVIAGGAVRKVMEAAGVKDVIAKSLGSGCGFNVGKATLSALIQQGKSLEYFAKLRGKTVKELVKE